MDNNSDDDEEYTDSLLEDSTVKSNNDRDPVTGERIGNFYGHKTNGEESDARDENFCQSLGRFCCPKIRINSTIVIITLIQLIIFIITCCAYGLSDDEFIAPDPKGIEWGWSDVRRIREYGEVWRFFTPTYLHVHIRHLWANLVLQLFLGTGIESGVGFLRILILYTLSGLGGLLLSMDVRPQIHSVGASCAVYGLVGFYIAYSLTNFTYMGRERPGQRFYLLGFAAIAILANLHPENPKALAHVDIWGHIGGLITGFFVGLATTEFYDMHARSKERVPDRLTRAEYERKGCFCLIFRYFGMTTTTLWFLALFIVFFTIDLDSLPSENENDKNSGEPQLFK